MKIELNNFTIYSDGLNCYITEKKLVKEGRFKGNTTEARVSGYFRTLKEAIEDMFTRKVYSSDADSLEKAIEDIEKAKTEALTLIDEFADRELESLTDDLK